MPYVIIYISIATPGYFGVDIGLLRDQHSRLACSYCPLPAGGSSWELQYQEIICSRQKTDTKAQAHDFISQSNLEEIYVNNHNFNLQETL